jgi:hypothetical protein
MSKFATILKDVIMLKVRIDSSGLMIYAQGDSTSKRVANSKQMLSVPRQSGKIGARGRQLVKLYSKLLGETILAFRESAPVEAIRRKINACFITLTLPASQTHDDGELNRHALGRFITEARRNGWFEHYVWRAEVQKNGSAHWHILVDREIDAQEVRKHWNRIMNDLGYVGRYQKKMSQLNLEQYIEMRKPQSDEAMSKAIKAFNVGMNENWTNPNSSDIQRVRSIQGLKKYVSKYMSKASDGESRDWHSRHWGASDSLRDLLELRIEVKPDELCELVQNAVQLDMYVVGLDHCTYIRANEAELRVLRPDWWKRLKEVQTSNRHSLFSDISLCKVGETDEIDELDYGLLDSLYFTVCETQMECSFDIHSRP